MEALWKKRKNLFFFWQQGREVTVWEGKTYLRNTNFWIQFDDHLFQQQPIYLCLSVHSTASLELTPSQAAEPSKVKALPPLFRSGSLKSTAAPGHVLATAHATQRPAALGWATGGWAQPDCCPGHRRCCTFHRAVAQHRRESLPSSHHYSKCCPQQLFWTSVDRAHALNWTREKDTTVAEALGWDSEHLNWCSLVYWRLTGPS